MAASIFQHLFGSEQSQPRSWRLYHKFCFRCPVTSNALKISIDWRLPHRVARGWEPGSVSVTPHFRPVITWDGSNGPCSATIMPATIVYDAILVQAVNAGNGHRRIRCMDAVMLGASNGMGELANDADICTSRHESSYPISLLLPRFNADMLSHGITAVGLSNECHLSMSS